MQVTYRELLKSLASMDFNLIDEPIRVIVNDGEIATIYCLQKWQVPHSTIKKDTPILVCG